MRRWNRGYAELALERYGHVAEVEPDFVPAALGITEAIVFLVGRGWRNAHVEYPRVIERLDRLLLVFPDYGELSIARGVLDLFYTLDWASAYAHIERGLTGASPSSEGYAQLSYFWFGMREFDRALSALDAALESNPLSTSLINMRGDILVGARRFAEARSVHASILEVLPNDKVVFENLLSLAILQERFADARRHMRKLLGDGTATARDYPRLAYAYGAFARTAAKESARTKYAQLCAQVEAAARAELADEPSANPYPMLACLAAGARKWDEALAALEQMFARRQGIIFLVADPILEPLRTHPRYLALVQQIRMPTELSPGRIISLRTELRGEVRVDVDALLYARSEGHYVTLVAYRNFRLEETLLRITLRGTLAQLPSEEFWRCHRSAFVRANLSLDFEGNARGGALRSAEYGFTVRVSRANVAGARTQFAAP